MRAQDMDQKRLIAVAKRGFVRVRMSELARACELSEGSIRRWLAGEELSPESGRKIKRGLRDG